MKKLLILVATLMTGGLALPASAQGHCHQAAPTTVFISGYLPCGSPIYSKRVRVGRYYQTVRLSGYELNHYLERQRRISAQRDYERRIARERYIRSRSAYRYQPRYQPRCR